MLQPRTLKCQYPKRRRLPNGPSSVHHSPNHLRAPAPPEHPTTRPPEHLPSLPPPNRGHAVTRLTRLTGLTRLTRQVFQVSAPFPNSDFDGIFGLAFNGLAAPTGLQTPLDLLQKAYGGKMRDQVFSFRMSDAAAPGELRLGAVAVESYPQGIRWVDVLQDVDNAGKVSYGFWAVSMDSVSFAGTTLSGRVGLMDSGTSCLVLPSKDAAAFYDAVRKAQGRDARCSALPHLTLTLGGQDYVLTGDDYGRQQLGGCQLCVQAREERRPGSSGMCSTASSR
ncbi:unnamed protein product [Effrenium voratum]|nr:unnamed protein product [Effrenium voratum]